MKKIKEILKAKIALWQSLLIFIPIIGLNNYLDHKIRKDIKKSVDVLDSAPFVYASKLEKITSRYVLGNKQRASELKLIIEELEKRYGKSLETLNYDDIKNLSLDNLVTENK